MLTEVASVISGASLSIRHHVTQARSSRRPAGPLHFPMTSGPVPTEADVLEALRAVIDPELGRQRRRPRHGAGVQVTAEGAVRVDVALTIAGCPLRAQIDRDVRGRLASAPRRQLGRRSGWARWTRTPGPRSWHGPAGRPGSTPPRDGGPGHHPDPGRRLGQGRGRQVVGHGQPGRRAGPAGPHRRRARRRHLGVLGARGCSGWRAASRPGRAR